ncbi:MAG: hypothetical protein M0Z41_17275 [Peptococcaceae bacterium]|nr:hypothetical protein [Peptococcaceae bacterium]
MPPHFQRPPKVRYALFSRSGFTEELHRLAEDSLLLFEGVRFHPGG